MGATSGKSQEQARGHGGGVASRSLPEGLKAPDPADAALSDTVAALREEIRGLRAAARTHAVIELAKGVLVERHQISLDEAFNRLRTMSQEHNVRLVEVAATVVGIAVPKAEPALSDLPKDLLRDRLPSSPSASPSWTALQAQPDVRVGVLTALIDSAAGATDDGDEAAALLGELLAPQGVSAVVLYRGAPDDSLRLVGHSGVAGDLVSAWRSIPPSRDIPYVVSYMDDRALFWADGASLGRDFPAIAATRSAFEATATVPITDSGQVLGVAGLMWLAGQDFDAGRRAAITQTVGRVGPVLLRNTAAADPELEWLSTLLRLHLDPWLLLDAVPSADGVIRDLVVQDVSQQVGEGTEWIGRRLLETWPCLAGDGVAQALSVLAHSGGSWTTTVTDDSAAPWGIPGSRIRAVRLGRQIVLAWRPGRTADRRSPAA